MTKLERLNKLVGEEVSTLKMDNMVLAILESNDSLFNSECEECFYNECMSYYDNETEEYYTVNWETVEGTKEGNTFDITVKITSIDN